MIADFFVFIAILNLVLVVVDVVVETFLIFVMFSFVLFCHFICIFWRGFYRFLNRNTCVCVSLKALFIFF